MSIELILGGIGTVLGVANFVYWAWWSKRDKVEIVNPSLYADFLRKGTREEYPLGDRITLQHNTLSIDVSCELVLTQGERELEVKKVEVIFDEKAYKGLIQIYFHLPLHNSLRLEQGETVFPPILLAPKKSVRFRIKRLFDCTAKFEKEYGKLEGGSYPEFIRPFLAKLMAKYQICWTRYDGKELCWHFPNKWWRNLGKKLWG